MDPHEADPHEDPEQHIGEVIADPWEDDRQADWATGRLPQVGTEEPPPWPPGS